MTDSMRRWVDAEGDAPDAARHLLKSARQPDSATMASVWARVEASVAAGPVAATAAARAVQPLWRSAFVKGGIAVVVVVAAATVGLTRRGPEHRSGEVARAAPVRAAVGLQPVQVEPALGRSASVQVPLAPIVPSQVPPAIPLPAATPATPLRESTSGARPATNSPRSILRDASIAPEPSGTAGAHSGGVSELDAEIALVSSARAMLSTAPAQALVMVDGGGMTLLQHEREAIAVDALIRLGRFTDAIARADRFLAANPQSTSAPRVRILRDTAAREGGQGVRQGSRDGDTAR